MDKDKLTPREQALIAAARREAAARKEPPAPTPAAAPAPSQAPSAKPAPTAAERLAQLMADEREQTLERKRKMRRYGIIGAGSILALFALWVLRAVRRR